MPDYKRLYLLLFNAFTDIERAIDEMNFGLARQRIIEAQQRAESLYLEEEAP